MSDNLTLWNLVEKTPPSETKPITGKAYSGTSPKPHYLVRKATEVFGPIGIGWGFTILDERIEEGAPGDKLHIARLRVWYMWDGKRAEVEHIGATPFSGVRSSGKSFIDEDSAKKSVTDALVKALSMIGFAGDIFSGRYDDSKYVNELRQEERQERQAASNDGAAIGPSIAAQRMAREFKDCRSADDIDRLKRTTEFRDFWSAASRIDQEFVKEAASAATARLAGRAAA